MEHISHDRKERWLRKVHAGQAIVSGSVVGAVEPDSDEGTAKETDEAGRDDESCLDGGARAIGVGTEARGTPHSPHILAAAGLRPGGLR